MKKKTSKHESLVAKQIRSSLKELGVDCKLMKTEKAPQITTFYYNLAESKLISKVTEKTMDVVRDQLKMKLDLTRGAPPYSFAVTMTNKKRAGVMLKKLKQPVAGHALAVNVGKDIKNHDVIIDFGKVNHMLVAGTTGSGKSVFVNVLLAALYKTYSSLEFELWLIDPKRVSFIPFKGVTNASIVTEFEDAVQLLQNMVEVMERRYTYMEQRGITDQNVFTPIFIVVDELAELMLTNREACEANLIRLLQKARQANIHMVLATQRPTVDIVSGAIKAQCDTRVCLKMASAKDSTTVLDNGAAYKLLGHGDGIIKFPYDVGQHRFQSAFVSEEEIKNILKSACM